MTQRQDAAAKLRIAAHANPVAQAGFTIIPNAVMLRRDIGSDAKLVYGYLKHLCWRWNATETASHREVIARDLNLSEKLVTKAMRQLSAAPVIEGDHEAPPLVVSIRRGQGLTNLYRINDPEYVPEIPAELAQATTEQRAAWKAVHYALRNGTLVRLVCEVHDCTREDTEAHHEDYSRPLDVDWLCPDHHREWHQIVGSGKALSSFLDEPDGPHPARARSSSRRKTTTEERDPPNPPPLEQPPPVVLAGHRNVPLDVLMEVCSVPGATDAERMARAVVALNGRLHKTTGAVLRPGLRHAFWEECRRQAARDDAQATRPAENAEARLRALQADGPRFAALLADRIRVKAAAYRRGMPGAMCTPKALLDWWPTVGTLEGSGITADEIERMNLPDA